MTCFSSHALEADGWLSGAYFMIGDQRKSRQRTEQLFRLKDKVLFENLNIDIATSQNPNRNGSIASSSESLSRTWVAGRAPVCVKKTR
jgi:hypothetical protein